MRVVTFLGGVLDNSPLMARHGPSRLISDIHGNYVALEAVLEDIAAQGVTSMLGGCRGLWPAADGMYEAVFEVAN